MPGRGGEFIQFTGFKLFVVASAQQVSSSEIPCEKIIFHSSINNGSLQLFIGLSNNVTTVDNQIIGLKEGETFVFDVSEITSKSDAKISPDQFFVIANAPTAFLHVTLVGV